MLLRSQLSAAIQPVSSVSYENPELFEITDRAAAVGRKLGAPPKKRPVASTIFFPHRVENIERLGRLVQDNHSVENIAGYAKHVARPQRLLFAADEKRHPARQHHAHLLMWMRVLLHNGVRLQIDQRQHHLLSGAGLDGY